MPCTSCGSTEVVQHRRTSAPYELAEYCKCGKWIRNVPPVTFDEITRDLEHKIAVNRSQAETAWEQVRSYEALAKAANKRELDFMRQLREHVQKPRAFSLIELLVVISIIALLIGILLPCLSGARSASRQITCTANLNSLVKVLHAYANDYHNIPAYTDPYPMAGRIAALELSPASWVCPADYRRVHGDFDGIGLGSYDYIASIYAHDGNGFDYPNRPDMILRNMERNGMRNVLLMNDQSVWHGWRNGINWDLSLRKLP